MKLLKKVSNSARMFVLSVSALLFTACAGVVTHPDWEFVRSVGGISVGELEMIDGNYYLPVNMSVASYSSKSPMVCIDSDTRVAGKQIYLTVTTDSKKNVPNASAECPKAMLGGIPDGNYRVMYRGPEGNLNKVGDVTADLANAPIGSH